MRILVLSDIHANLTALDAVLNHAGEVDQVWCLGDLVGYGPDPDACIDRLRRLPRLQCVMGNHDAAACGRLHLDSFNHDARKAILWTISQLSSESLEFLDTRPEILKIDSATLAHGSPRNPIWEYILEPRAAAETFDSFQSEFCLVGHTHLPILFVENAPNVRWLNPADNERIRLTTRAILNPGSVGQPRDHNPAAAYAIFDPAEREWEAHRVPYDISDVQARMHAARLPERSIFRLEEGW